MAVVPEDAVRVRARKVWRGIAAVAALSVAILLLAGLAVRLIGGFFGQLRALLRLLLF